MVYIQVLAWVQVLACHPAWYPTRPLLRNHAPFVVYPILPLLPLRPRLRCASMFFYPFIRTRLNVRWKPQIVERATGLALVSHWWGEVSVILDSY